MAFQKQNPAAIEAHRVREIDQAGERVNREYNENSSTAQYRPIATVPKSGRKEFRIGIRSYNGTRKIEIRVFELNHTGIWNPASGHLVIGLGAIGAITAALCEGEQLL